VGRTTLRAGESLLVDGAAGGVGRLAVQIAKALGAGLVIGTASTAQRRLMTRSQALIGFYLPVFFDRPELIGTALRFLADSLKTGQITSPNPEECHHN
jgi:NADPH2:quinone reductase